jgi:hypothetical protein
MLDPAELIPVLGERATVAEVNRALRCERCGKKDGEVRLHPRTPFQGDKK